MRRFLRSVFRLFPQNEAKARTRQLERNNDNKFQGIGRETKEVRNIRDHDQWKREMSSHSYVYTFSIFFFLPPEDLNDSTVKHEFPRLVARDERWRPTCSPDTFHSIFLSRVSPPSSYSALHHHVIISIRKKEKLSYKVSNNNMSIQQMVNFHPIGVEFNPKLQFLLLFFQIMRSTCGNNSRAL